MSLVTKEVTVMVTVVTIAGVTETMEIEASRGNVSGMNCGTYCDIHDNEME